MQFNYNTRLSSRTSFKRKVITFLFYVLVCFLFLFLLSKISFPVPKKEIKINISNEIIKLK